MAYVIVFEWIGLEAASSVKFIQIQILKKNKLGVGGGGSGHAISTAQSFYICFSNF